MNTPVASLPAKLLTLADEIDNYHWDVADWKQAAVFAERLRALVTPAMEGALPELPEFPVALERFVLSSLSPFKADAVRTELRSQMRAYGEQCRRLATPKQPDSAVQVEAVACEDTNVIEAACRAFYEKWDDMAMHERYYARVSMRRVSAYFTTPPPAPANVDDLAQSLVQMYSMSAIVRALDKAAPPGFTITLLGTPPAAAPRVDKRITLREGVERGQVKGGVTRETATNPPPPPPPPGRRRAVQGEIEWLCNCCTARFHAPSNPRPSCPHCKAHDQFTYTTPPSAPDLDAVVVLLNHLEDLMDRGILPEDAILVGMWNAASAATRPPAPSPRLNPAINKSIRMMTLPELLFRRHRVPPGAQPEAAPEQPEGKGALTEVERKALGDVLENLLHDAADTDDSPPSMDGDEDAYWAFHSYHGLRKLLAAAPAAPVGVDEEDLQLLRELRDSIYPGEGVYRITFVCGRSPHRVLDAAIAALAGKEGA